MGVALIINLALLALVLFGFLKGYCKGTLKSLTRFIYLLVLFIVVWLLVPAIYNWVEPMIPESVFEAMSDYITKEEFASLAPFMIRALLTPLLWFVLSIVTLPIYYIIYFIVKKLCVPKVQVPTLSDDKKERKRQLKAYRKAKKPNNKSRLIGAGIGIVQTVSIIFAMCLPIVGTYETLRDDKTGEVRCVKIGDFNSCEYTDEYEKTVLSKMFSVGNVGSKTFNLMSTGKALGEKASFGKDINNLVNIYFIFQDNGVDITDEIDYIKLLSQLDRDEVMALRGYLNSSRFLMSIVDNIGLRILVKSLELDTKYGIDMSEVLLSEEIAILMEVAASIIDLPITKDDDFNNNFVELINSVDDKFVDDLVANLKESKALDAIMDGYGKEKIEKTVNKKLSEYNETFSLSLDNVEVEDELKIVINAVRDLASVGVLKYDSEKDKTKVKSLKELAKDVNKQDLENAVNGLFDSAILTQVVEGVAPHLVVDYLNDTLEEEYTLEELGLNDVNWKEELSHDVSLIIDFANEGIMDAVADEENILNVISDSENKDALIDSMTESKLIVSLLDTLAPTYVEEMVRPLIDDPDYTLDIEALDIDWNVELKALIDSLDMLNDGGLLTSVDFDFIGYISSLSDADVTKLSNSMTSSKILLEVFPTLAENVLGDLDEDINVDDIDWKVELEPMLKVVKLFDSYGMFEDSADKDEIVKEMIKVESNIDVIFASDTVYEMVVSTIEEEVAKVEVDGKKLVDIPEGGFNFSKAEWKEEVLILSTILDDMDIVEEFSNIGDFDPTLEETEQKLTKMGNMIDSLLVSRMFAQPLADEINDLLEVEEGNEKTVDELKTTSWDVELIVANEILYQSNTSEIDIEDVDSFITLSSPTIFVKELLSDKVKENLETIEVDGELVFTHEYVDSLDIYEVDWSKEKEAIEALDTVEDIPLPSDPGFDADISGTALNDVMALVNQTVVTKDVAKKTIDDKLKGELEPYFYSDILNPTDEEIKELDDYVEGADVLNADYVLELRLLDTLNEADVTEAEYGARLDRAVIDIEQSTVVGPIADDEFREILADEFGSYFAPGYFDTLVLSTISWETETSKYSSLDTFTEDYDAITEIDSVAGSKIDTFLADVAAPVEINGEMKYSVIAKTVVEQEMKDRIKTNLTDVYDGDASFIDELDIYNMNKYNSSFEKEFAAFDSLEEVTSDTYEFDITHLAAFEEGGLLFNVANSVLASNILDGSDVTISVINDDIKTAAIEKVDGMSSCVSSLDETNTNYGKDVLKSLFIVE